MQMDSWKIPAGRFSERKKEGNALRLDGEENTKGEAARNCKMC